jgi:hypothetical protein
MEHGNIEYRYEFGLQGSTNHATWPFLCFALVELGPEPHMWDIHLTFNAAACTYPYET